MKLVVVVVVLRDVLVVVEVVHGLWDVVVLVLDDVVAVSRRVEVLVVLRGACLRGVYAV